MKHSGTEKKGKINSIIAVWQQTTHKMKSEMWTDIKSKKSDAILFDFGTCKNLNWCDLTTWKQAFLAWCRRRNYYHWYTGVRWSLLVYDYEWCCVQLKVILKRRQHGEVQICENKQSACRYAAYSTLILPWPVGQCWQSDTLRPLARNGDLAISSVVSHFHGDNAFLLVRSWSIGGILSQVNSLTLSM